MGQLVSEEHVYQMRAMSECLSINPIVGRSPIAYSCLPKTSTDPPCSHFGITTQQNDTHWAFLSKPLTFDRIVQSAAAPFTKSRQGKPTHKKDCPLLTFLYDLHSPPVPHTPHHSFQNLQAFLASSVCAHVALSVQLPAHLVWLG